LTDVKLTRCYPCVSTAREPETKRKVFTAEIRLEASSAKPMQLGGRQLHSTATEAFQELVAKVKRLPLLLHSFEIVVGSEVFQDAEKAADAISQNQPHCPE
jgi:hypothetical protein